MKLLTSAE